MIDIKAPTKFMIVPIDGDMENASPVIVDVGANNTMQVRRADGDGNVVGLFPPGSAIDVVTLRLMTSDGTRKRRAA